MSAKPKKLPTPPPEPAPGAEGTPAGIPPGCEHVSLSATVDRDRIRPSPLNPRKAFPEELLRALAGSFDRHGVLKPLIVRPHPLAATCEGGRWVGLEYLELVDGERRWRAAELADPPLPRLPVLVRWYTDEQAREIMLASDVGAEHLLPSERAAAAQELAGRVTAEEAARRVGLPLSQVRDLCRLARLPAWALAAVDAGRLPVATAALVARVGGEQSRAKAALCVLLGAHHPTEITHSAPAGDWAEKAEGWLAAHKGDALSFRDAKALLRHFQVELKAAPFSRKSLDLVPAAGSCDACPKRAGNDPESRAEGVRADVCLDPDCYRSKVDAYRAAEITRAAAKGIPEADIGVVTFPANTPRGWCQLDHPADQTELTADLTGKTPEKLKDLLGDACPQKHLAFGPGGKAVLLVKTTEAREALQAAGVLARPDKRPTKPRAAAEPKPWEDAPKPEPKPAGPSAWEIDEKAAGIAGGVLAEFAETNFDDLKLIEACAGDEPYTSAVWEAFHFLARFLIRDHLAFGQERAAVVAAALGLDPPAAKTVTVEAAEAKLKDMPPARVLAVCFRLAAECELNAAPRGPFAREFLDWAELDWDHLRDQAGRTLRGEPSADERIAAADVPTCRVCGCTDADCSGCIAKTGTPCSWAEPDLCSACVPAADLDAPFAEPGDIVRTDYGTGTPLAGIPKFPPAVAEYLAGKGYTTLEHLRTELKALQGVRGRANSTLYSVLRELGVPGNGSNEAGDALTDYLDPPAAAVPEPKPAKKKGAKAK